MKSVEGELFKGLTEDEIYGNIFVYNFAVHDTTATTLNWALYLLAAFPEVQYWIAEEINDVLGDKGDDPSTWEFKDVYPRLDRCPAILYETLRLWNPLLRICYSTFLIPQPLTVGDITIIIPPETRVIPNSNAIHTLPRYLDKDSIEWKLSRWIISTTSLPKDYETKSYLSNEYLMTAKNDTYVAWSDGVRPCPGKKFSQVEFVTVMASSFRRHRVEAVPNLGETAQEARGSVKQCVNDNRIVLLLQMKDPKSVGLRWVEV